MRYAVVLCALLVTSCSHLSPQDHANLWACYAQLHALSQSVQEQVPACSALVDSLKSQE
jgi:hypothetical protein